MHRDHDVFIQGVEQKRRIKINFSNRKNPQNLPMQCAPLHYSKERIEGDNLGCYYLWDFEAVKGSHFLALSPSQITAMELTAETFKTEDFRSFRRTTDGLTKSSVT